MLSVSSWPWGAVFKLMFINIFSGDVSSDQVQAHIQTIFGQEERRGETPHVPQVLLKSLFSMEKKFSNAANRPPLHLSRLESG